jgi:hypothetical protein
MLSKSCRVFLMPVGERGDQRDQTSIGLMASFSGGNDATPGHFESATPENRSWCGLV